MIIRGISSINPSQSNAPLYVLDGVAISGGVSDINPNDIESIEILKELEKTNPEQKTIVCFDLTQMSVASMRNSFFSDVVSVEVYCCGGYPEELAYFLGCLAGNDNLKVTHCDHAKMTHPCFS